MKLQSASHTLLTGCLFVMQYGINFGHQPYFADEPAAQPG